MRTLAWQPIPNVWKLEENCHVARLFRNVAIERGKTVKTSVMKAIALILSADPELLDILSVTAQMSIQSSIFALLIGLPIGIWLGACKFPGRNVLMIVNRTLMGMPPVVCGLVFYMLFSGVGPFRHLKLLFTVDIMIMAQIVLITPIVVGNMETYVALLPRSERFSSQTRDEKAHAVR